MPGLQQPIGLVVNVYPGRDGLIRSVDVKTKQGIFKRSIQTLHDLEINYVLDSSENYMSGKAISTNEVGVSTVNNDVAKDEMSVHDSDIEDEVDVTVYTRRGLLVKRTHKLDL